MDEFTKKLRKSILRLAKMKESVAFLPTEGENTKSEKCKRAKETAALAEVRLIEILTELAMGYRIAPEKDTGEE